MQSDSQRSTYAASHQGSLYYLPQRWTFWPPSGHTQNRAICVRSRRRLTSRARRAESAIR